MLDFDWYQATLLGVDDPHAVAARLLTGSGALVLKPGAGGYNRPHSLRGKSAHGGSLALYFGDGLDVHVVGTSSFAPHTAAVLREHYPAHTVSRADVALDFDAPGVFDLLWRTVHGLAAGRVGRPVGTSLAGDWLDGANGRTLYAGGPTSRLRVRVYEKGHEQRSKHPDREFSLNWARVEWSVRPSSKQKRAAASAPVEELAAWTAFGAAVLREIYGLDLEPRAPQRVASTEPLYWLVRQYGAHLRAMVALEPDLTIAQLLARVETTSTVPAG